MTTKRINKKIDNFKLKKVYSTLKKRVLRFEYFHMLNM